MEEDLRFAEWQQTTDRSKAKRSSLKDVMHIGGVKKRNRYAILIVLSDPFLNQDLLKQAS